MKIYQETRNGGFAFEGRSIPADINNRDYAQLLKEVAWGDATAVPYEGSVEDVAAKLEESRQGEREADVTLLRSDVDVRRLLKARPDKINNYIDNNVTDLDSAKEVLKILSRAVAVLASTIVN